MFEEKVSFTSYKQEAPWVILLIILSMIGYGFLTTPKEDLQWYPIYWLNVIFIIMLATSSMIIGKKFGLFYALIAFFWPNIYQWVIKNITGEFNGYLVPMMAILLIQLIASILFL